MTNWQDRPEKTEARRLILKGLPPSRSALFMPAAKCLCVKQAIELGVLSEASHVLAVEKRADIASQMKGTLGRIQVQSTSFHGMLHDVRLRSPLDFVFLDLNGTMTEATARWISQELAKKILPGATFVITLAMDWRYNTFIGECQRFLLKEANVLVERLADETECNDYGLILDIAMIQVLFRQWRFKTEFVLRYRDSTPMSAYRLYDFQPAELLPYQLKGTKIVTNRSDAAIKAWETRRANSQPAVKPKTAPNDWRPVTFDNVPSREALEQMTLQLMAEGVTNSERMRAAVSQNQKLIIDNDVTSNWNDSPSSKFVNEHAHVLRNLVIRKVIQPVRAKEYRFNH